MKGESKRRRDSMVVISLSYIYYYYYQGNVMFGICLGAAVLYIGSSLEDVSSVLQ